MSGKFHISIFCFPLSTFSFPGILLRDYENGKDSEGIGKSESSQEGGRVALLDAQGQSRIGSKR
jgi:hypothetical protein